MISVAEARKIIKETIVPLAPITVLLNDAAGKVLASDVFASVDVPAFPQSSMDGYAFHFNSWKQNQKLRCEGEIAAGSAVDEELKPGKAIRIFTGAPVPKGADTVIIQEKVKLEKDELIFEDTALQPGANVRPRGSEIKAGELALPKGSLLTPAAIGFLAGIGIDKVSVFPRAVISIIITGKELQAPGSPLAQGQVYESNSFTLAAALQQLHATNVVILRADDDLAELTNTLKNALQQSDMVLLTGGVSAGDYDFVIQAATACGVSTLFHKIKQRPGKPLFFGKQGNKLVFGLPGNPSSVLTCFYEYVVPAFFQMGHQEKGLERLHVPLANALQKKAGLTCFMKGYYDGKRVTALDAQESYRLSSFAKANCLIVVEEEVVGCKEQDLMEIHLLPV